MDDVKLKAKLDQLKKKRDAQKQMRNILVEQGEDTSMIDGLLEQIDSTIRTLEKVRG